MKRFSSLDTTVELLPIVGVQRMSLQSYLILLKQQHHSIQSKYE